MVLYVYKALTGEDTRAIEFSCAVGGGGRASHP